MRRNDAIAITRVRLPDERAVQAEAEEDRPPGGG